jgi:hypothetical protein
VVPEPLSLAKELQPEYERLTVLFWLLLVLGFVLSGWYQVNQIVDGDQLQMIKRGYEAAYLGVWPATGNAASVVGNVPGFFSTAVVAGPLLLWDSPYAPIVLLMAMRLAGFLMIDAVIRDVFPGSAAMRVVAVLVLWLNPWVQYDSLLYNPAYLIFCAGLHLYTSWRMRFTVSFKWTFLHVLAIALASSAGLTAAIVHFFNHALMKAALFTAVAGIMLRYGTTNLDGLAGLGRRMPLTMLGFVFAGLSLIGVPLTAGFISKWYLIQAVLEEPGLGILLTMLILLASLMAVVYIWKVVEVAYFKAPANGSLQDVKRQEAPLPILVMLWLLVAANIWFGIDPSLPLKVAGMEIGYVLGVSQ